MNKLEEQPQVSLVVPEQKEEPKIGDKVEVLNNNEKIIGEIIEVRTNGKILVSFKNFGYKYSYRNSSYLPHRYKILK